MSDWDKISFITSSKLRFRILIELKKGEKTPSTLAELLSEARSHISKSLKELEKNSLVECLTPKRRKNKFFKITELGQTILKKINEITN